MTDTTEKFGGTDGSAGDAGDKVFLTAFSGNPKDMVWRVWVWRDTGRWVQGHYLVRGTKVQELMNLSTLMRSVTMREANEVEKEYWWKRSDEDDVVQIRRGV